MAGRAGSLLIDIAANIAKLRTDFDEATATVQGFAKKIEGVASLVKTALEAIGIAALVHQLKAYGDQLEQNGAEIERQAQRYKLTTDQVQALQVVAQRTGQSMDELAKIGKQNAQWLKDVEDGARKAGLVIDNEFTRSLKSMTDHAADSKRQFDVLITTLSTPLKNTFLDFVNTALWNIRQSLTVIRSDVGILDKVGAAANIAGLGIPGASSEGRDAAIQRSMDRTTQLLGNVEALNARMKEAESGALQVVPAQVEAWQRQRALYENELNNQAELRRKLLANEPTAMGAITVPALRDTGGGAAPTNKAGSVLDALNAEIDGVKAGLDKFRAMQAEATDDAKRQAELRVDIAHRVAQALRRADTQDPTARKGIEDAATSLEKLKFELAEVERVQKTADEVNKEYGDGTRELTNRLADLNDALKANRINQEEYNRATRAAQRTQAERADRAAGQEGGLGGFMAGIRSAAREASDPMNDFKAGSQVFENSVSIMTDALKKFRDTGVLSFGDVAKSFADMLADMAMQLAARAVLGAIFDAILGGVSGGGGSPMSQYVPTGGTQVSSAGSWIQTAIKFIGGAFSFGGARQHGGDVNPSQWFWVGEKGPERFVPNVAGRVEPAANGNVTINNFAPGVDVQARRRDNGDLDVVVAAAKKALTRDVIRGGNEFASAMERTYRVARGGA